MIRAVLLDLDGTLVDSAPELAVAVNRVRQAFGLPEVSLESVRDWVGEGVDVLLRSALRGSVDLELDVDARRRARSVFNESYAAVLGTSAVPCPGVPEGLEQLHAAGMPLACVTNKPEQFARLLLESLGLLSPFGVIAGGDSTEALKPDAAPVRFAAGRLGVEVGNCLLVGDSAIDVETARNAGCPVWCVRSGYDRGRPVEKVGADAVFDRFDELVDSLLS